MRSLMSLQSKREVLAQIAPRYRAATQRQKTQILDAFVAATGYARKYAIRLLTEPQLPRAVPTRSRDAPLWPGRPGGAHHCLAGRQRHLCQAPGWGSIHRAPVLHSEHMFFTC